MGLGFLFLNNNSNCHVIILPGFVQKYNHKNATNSVTKKAKDGNLDVL